MIEFSKTVSRRHFAVNDTHSFLIVKESYDKWWLVISTRGGGPECCRRTFESRNLAIAVAQGFERLDGDLATAVAEAYNADFAKTWG